MTHIETLKLTDPHDHPEPHTMKWTQLEMDYINKRVEAAVRQAIEQAEQAPPPSQPLTDWWCPDVCPITGRPFFMWIEHHETGRMVPTYGGPYDSYTIPVQDKDGSYCRERYDHDRGGWLTDEIEDVGIQIVSDQAYVSDEAPPPRQPEQAPTAAKPSNCIECANADSWGLPDKLCCKSCVSGSQWSPLNTYSVNPNVPSPPPRQPEQEPVATSIAAKLRAMACNYPAGHLWDKLDAKVCLEAAWLLEGKHPKEAPPPRQTEQAEQKENLVGLPPEAKSCVMILIQGTRDDGQQISSVMCLTKPYDILSLPHRAEQLARVFHNQFTA